ncbi:MAG TPA: outer membrane beta-barrel protein [Cytophagaceae bacterium]|jgi:hypothetical protein|nr:outer membrane beta-barrel protein [Cytophagaceae bacterium]
MTKRISLFVLFIIISIRVFSQYEKGTIQIGVMGSPLNFGINKNLITNKNTIESTHTPEINLYFGYFILKNFSIGIMPYYTSNFTKESYETFRTKGYGGNVYLRHYYLVRKKISLYSQLGIGAGGHTYMGSPSLFIYSNAPLITRLYDKGFNFMIGTGISYFINHKFSLEFMINYFNENHYKGSSIYTDPLSHKTTTTTINGSAKLIIPSIGLNFFIHSR